VKPKPPRSRRGGDARTEGQAKEGRAPKSSGSAKPEILGIAISNPQKAMWPDAGDRKPVTKLDLAQYYEGSASGCCRISRASPVPSSGHRRFAKETVLPAPSMLGMSKALDEIKVSATGSPPYLVINSVEGLIRGRADRRARAPFLELPARQARCYRPSGLRSRPGARCWVRGCHRGRQGDEGWLEVLGPPPSCKTTGGKGRMS